jgi:hypothetical protein
MDLIWLYHHITRGKGALYQLFDYLPSSIIAVLKGVEHRLSVEGRHALPLWSMQLITTVYSYIQHGDNLQFLDSSARSPSCPTKAVMGGVSRIAVD